MPNLLSPVADDTAGEIQEQSPGSAASRGGGGGGASFSAVDSAPPTLSEGVPPAAMSAGGGGGGPNGRQQQVVRGSRLDEPSAPPPWMQQQGGGGGGGGGAGGAGGGGAQVLTKVVKKAGGEPTFGLSISPALCVGDMKAGGAAERAGLSDGDQIVSVLGVGVSSRDQVLKLLKGLADGEPLTMEVRRQQQQQPPAASAAAASGEDVTPLLAEAKEALRQHLAGMELRAQELAELKRLRSATA